MDLTSYENLSGVGSSFYEEESVNRIRMEVKQV
jgi:hypothetical protein